MTKSWERTVLYTPYPQATDRLSPVLGAIGPHCADLVVCDSVDSAVEALAKTAGKGAVALVDAVAGMSEEGLERTIAKLKDRMPFLATVVVGKGAPARLVQAALRAEVLDFIDLKNDDASSMERCCQRIAIYLKNVGDAPKNKAITTVLHRFMRSLIQSERRRIDLENQLQQAIDDHRAEMASILDEDREPVVLVVGPDDELLSYLTQQLHDSGLTTYGFRDGATASTRVATMVGLGKAVDAVVIDSDLPDQSAVALAQELRKYAPHLVLFIMGEKASDELREKSSSIRLAGFIKKPIKNLASLVVMLKEHALSAMQGAREHHYLQEIKRRHEDLFDQLIGISQADD